ncbi:unnamed protein product [Rhodiola kirilowii]
MKFEGSSVVDFLGPWAAHQCLGVSSCWRSLREGRRESEMEVSALVWMMQMIHTCSHGPGLSLVLQILFEKAAFTS